MFATEACMRQFQRSVQSPGEVRRLLRQLGLAQQVRIRRSYNAAMSSMYFLVEVAEPVDADRLAWVRLQLALEPINIALV